MSKSNVAVAPRSGVVGSKSHGGHVLAWRALKALPEGKVAIKLASNPWRVGTPGSDFCNAVLGSDLAYTGTTASLIKLAQVAGFKASEASSHLRWLYTWGVGTFTINGLAHGQSEAPAKAPRKAKAKAAPVASEAPASGTVSE
jgi:hypothetical protein